MKRWNKPQTGNAENQQKHLLPCCQIRIIAIKTGKRREDFHSSVQLHTNQHIKNAQTDECWQEQSCRISRRSDGASHPQHDRSHIANCCKTTTQTSRNHDGASIDDTLMMIPHNLRDNTHHQHHRCQVIHIGRDGKCQQRDEPQEQTAVAHTKPPYQRIKHTIVVQHFHNRISGNQKQNDRTSLTYILSKDILRYKILQAVTCRFTTSQIRTIIIAMHQKDKVLTI